MSARDRRVRAPSPMETDVPPSDVHELANHHAPASNTLGLFLAGPVPLTPRVSLQRPIGPSTHGTSHAPGPAGSSRAHMTKSPVPSTSARKRLENIDQTSDALSRLSLSPVLSRKSFAHSVFFEASSSHRERQEGAVIPRPGSRHSSVTLSAAGSPRFSVLPSVDTEQNFDVYEFEIDHALNLMNIGGTPALREHQASAIAHALNNQNIFLALATGAGKSLCFQIPAIIQARHHHQVTVVLQPTLEIISSQVRALSALGIDVEIISGLTSSEEKNALAVRLNTTDYRPALIYTTADSFVGHFNYVFTTLLGKGALARIILDEGHTILHWADFRPAMGPLMNITTSFEKVPITIATASLTLGDRTRLLNHLSIHKCHFITGSLDRPNLIYTVKPVHTFRHERKIKEVLLFLSSQFGLRPGSWNTQPKRSGLIYCSTAIHCDEVAKFLNKTFGEGYAAAVYGERPGMDQELQQARVKAWMDGIVQVLVATIAFGMGIDKSDVVFVIHYDMPKALENYIQETGRAGRSGQKAYCLLLYSWQDIQRSLFYADLTATKKDDPTISQTAAAKAVAMAQFASTLTTCRHSQLLAHFGAPLASLEPCADACDNCVQKKQLSVPLVVSGTARNIVDLFRSDSIQAAGGAHGIQKIINTLRGSGGKEVLPDKEQLGSLFGAARKVPYETVEAVFGAMLAHGVLRGVPIVKNGEPQWGTSLCYSLGMRSLEAELFEDTERPGRQMLLRTFAAAPADGMDEDVEDDAKPVVPPSSVKGRGKRPTRVISSDEDEDDATSAEYPLMSEKARGKQPERARRSNSLDNSSLSSLTSSTPTNSQSVSPRKRQREPKKSSPRKRGRIDSDEDYVESIAMSTRSLAATRSRRQKLSFARADEVLEISDDDEPPPPPTSRHTGIRGMSALPIEISDSSEDGDVALPVRRAPLVPAKRTQKARQPARKTATKSRASSSQDEDRQLIPDIEPPPELAAAFQILWDERRAAAAKYIVRDEREVLSDRTLLALTSIRQPLDRAAFTAALTSCDEENPGTKWTSYGSFFRTALRSQKFRGALPAKNSSIPSFKVSN